MGGKKSKPEYFLNEEYDEEEFDNKKADGALPIRLKANQLRVFTTSPDKPGQSSESLEILRYGLCLEPKIVNKFFSLFCAADTEDTGEINREQIYEFLDIPRNPFNNKLFGLFDFDNSGDIDFVEFVCAIWNLCTWEKSQLPRLMYTLYSPISGTMQNWLDYKVVVRMLNDCFAARKNKTTINMLISSLAAISVPGVVEGEERVYFNDFSDWVEIHPQAMQPVESMQRFLRNRILGKDWWVTVGVETRDRVISQMEEEYRDRFGNSGAHDAMTMAVHIAKEKRERSKEMRLKLRERRIRAFHLAAEHHKKQLAKQSKLAKSGKSDEELLHELQRKIAKMDQEHDEPPPDTPALPFQVEMARDRVEAYREFSKKRTRKFKEWNLIRKELMAERSPLSAMVQCQAPWLLDRLVEELEVEWRLAGEELRTQTYKPPKRTPVTNKQVYFQRKSGLDVEVGLAGLDTQVLSVAHGERSYEAEQVQHRRMLRGSLIGPLEDDYVESDEGDNDEAENSVRFRAFSTSGGSLHGHRPVSRQDELSKSRLGLRSRSALEALQNFDAGGARRRVTSFTPESDARFTIPSREATELLRSTQQRMTRPQTPPETDPRGVAQGFTSKHANENHKRVPEYYKRRMRLINKIKQTRLRLELTQVPVRIAPS